MATLPISGEQRRAALLALATRVGQTGPAADRRTASGHLDWLAFDCPEDLRRSTWRELVTLAREPLPATQVETVVWAGKIRKLLLTLVPPMVMARPGEQDAGRIASSVLA